METPATHLGPLSSYRVTSPATHHKPAQRARKQGNQVNGNMPVTATWERENRLAEIESNANAQRTISFQIAQVVKLAKIVPSISREMLTQALRVADAERELDNVRATLAHERRELAKLIV